MKYLCFLIYLITTLGFSAELPTNNRFEFMFGYNKLNYKEKVTNTFRLTSEREQTGYQGNLKWIYFWYPPNIYTQVDFDYTEGSISSDSPYESLRFLETTITAVAETSMLFDRFIFGLAISAIHFKNISPTQDFSLDSNLAFFAYPEVRFYPNFFRERFNYSFYFRYNLVKVNAPRDDLILGLRFYLPIDGKNPRYPLFAYQKNIVVQLEYSDTTIRDQTLSERTKVFNFKRYLLSIGLNF